MLNEALELFSEMKLDFMTYVFTTMRSTHVVS